MQSSPNVIMIFLKITGLQPGFSFDWGLQPGFSFDEALSLFLYILYGFDSSKFETIVSEERCVYFVFKEEIALGPTS